MGLFVSYHLHGWGRFFLRVSVSLLLEQRRTLLFLLKSVFKSDTRSDYHPTFQPHPDPYPNSYSNPHPPADSLRKTGV